MLKRVTDATYERALKSLLQMEFVGIVERFRESWELLSWLFGSMLSVRMMPPRHSNRAPEQTASFALSSEQRKILEEANSFDMRLYARACEQFDAELRNFKSTGQL